MCFDAARDVLGIPWHGEMAGRERRAASEYRLENGSRPARLYRPIRCRPPEGPSRQSVVVQPRKNARRLPARKRWRKVLQTRAAIASGSLDVFVGPETTAVAASSRLEFPRSAVSRRNVPG